MTGPSGSEGTDGIVCKKLLKPSIARICLSNSSHFSEKMQHLCILTSQWGSDVKFSLSIGQIPTTMQDVQAGHLPSQIDQQAVYQPDEAGQVEIYNPPFFDHSMALPW